MLSKEEAETLAQHAAEAAAERVALSQEDLAKLVRDSVHQTLIQLGIDNSNPLEMQRDFQHLRQWRKAGEDLRSKSIWFLASTVLAGAVTLLILGFKGWK